jgi:hypothetical protein
MQKLAEIDLLTVVATVVPPCASPQEIETESDGTMLGFRGALVPEDA